MHSCGDPPYETPFHATAFHSYKVSCTRRNTI